MPSPSIAAFFTKGKSQIWSYWTNSLMSLLLQLIPWENSSLELAFLVLAKLHLCYSSIWVCVEGPDKVWTARTEGFGCVPVHSSSQALPTFYFRDDYLFASLLCHVCGQLKRLLPAQHQPLGPLNSTLLFCIPLAAALTGKLTCTAATCLLPLH